MNRKNFNDIDKYIESCTSEFWRKIFRVELDYLVRHLEGYKDVLSVGCGPATIEGALSGFGFRVTGLDVSKEALRRAPDHIRTVAARAEDMDFPDSSFDAAIYVVSLQFMEHYQKALERTARVLRPAGRLIVMLLNPQSAFFKGKVADPASYVRSIKHTNLQTIERDIAKLFDIETEYFLGIKDEHLFESSDPAEASLYVIRGTPRPVGKGVKGS